MTEGENEMCIEFSDWLLSYVLTWWQRYNLYCNQPPVSVCLHYYDKVIEFVIAVTADLSDPLHTHSLCCLWA